MTINKTQTGEKLTLALSGRLDTTTSPQLQEVLVPAFDEAKEVTLDLKELAYTSSAGLRVILMGQKAAAAKAGTMTVINVPPDVMEVFEMTGFTDILTIV